MNLVFLREITVCLLLTTNPCCPIILNYFVFHKIKEIESISKMMMHSISFPNLIKNAGRKSNWNI